MAFRPAGRCRNACNPSCQSPRWRRMRSMTSSWSMSETMHVPGNNLHGNVVFRDGGDKASQIVLFSQYDSFDAEDLWKWMDGSGRKRTVARCSPSRTTAISRTEKCSRSRRGDEALRTILLLAAASRARTGFRSARPRPEQSLMVSKAILRRPTNNPLHPALPFTSIDEIA